ncbi:MAG: TlpA family protein disulfide reductase [Mycolicibacterium sp.]|uniref:TlpA family protein disulfide reductase n=1 Tax=Mycolicibacterium sp. TaxID=2320850 RepID=UPI003D11E9E7
MKGETLPDLTAFGYNYDHFGRDHPVMDQLGGVRVGEPAPDFTATRLDGQQVTLSDFRGRPVVVETGSVSCPMYVSHVESMNALAFRFPDVSFLVLYVREAHPGQSIGAHRDTAQKAAAARRVLDEESEGRTIVVDDLAGTAHRLYGEMPNTVHVIDADGIVAFRAMWNDPPAVEAALRKVLAGQDAGTVRSRFRPAGVPTVLRVLRRAGSGAIWDFVVAFPRLARSHIPGQTPSQN